MNKIPLQKGTGWDNPFISKHCRPIKFALPFFKNNHPKSKTAHILRSAIQHQDYKNHNKLRHISLHFWCGNGSFMHRGKMFADITDDTPICATCYGRAIGAGVFGERVINGKPVLFVPRDQQKRLEQKCPSL